MGLDLPQDLNEMRAIRGIRPEMVELYGKQFLPLIENSRSCYGEEAPVPRNPAIRRRPAVRSHVIHELSEDDEEIDDQNHRLVVDLCSDAEEIPGDVELESNYSFDDDDDEEDDDDALHTSHHFTPSHDPQVAAFNSRYTQAAGPGAPTAKAAPSRAGSKAPGAGFKKKSFRRKGSGSFGNSYGGVKKRAPKASASGGAAAPKRGAGGASRRGGGASGGGGAGAWSSIMAMPT